MTNKRVDHRQLTIVWHHHGYRPKQRLEVVWQFRPTSVAWVHCDERSASRNELDLTTFEHEPLYLYHNKLTSQPARLASGTRGRNNAPVDQL